MPKALFRLRYIRKLVFLVASVIPAFVGAQELIFSDGFETPRFSVGGNVSGLAGSGLILQLNGGADLSITANGAFGFTRAVDDGDNYLATILQQPTNPDQACEISNGSGTVNGAPVTDIVVNCPSAPPNLPTSPGFDFLSTIDFLYMGLGAPQSGVDPETIASERASVLRGVVFDGTGSPLAGATVKILNRPEFGSGITDSDGAYAMVVNGGGQLVVQAAFGDLLPAQRRLNVPWNRYVSVDDMALISLDPVVTPVGADSGETQLAVSTPTSDARGSRTGRMLFPAGTGIEMVMPDGSRAPLATMNFRITEYTVGEMGPERMPGTLPATSAYTYAIELSADEAIASGATSVELDQPAQFYVDNFLGFPTGEIVPNGYYDREQGLWVPSDNGRILEVTGVSGNLAEVDVDGDGTADSGSALAELGIDDAERLQLAQQFSVGESFWRIPITHFTPHDPNWPYEFPEDAEEPPEDEPEPEEPDPCKRTGSIIECQTRVLGEQLELVGTDAELHYRSNRVPGFKAASTANVRITSDALPVLPPTRIELIAEIAGQQHTFDYATQPDLSEQFTWDRKDAFGRTVQGRQPLITTVRNYYEVIYTGASNTASAAFGAPGNGAPLGGSSGVEDYLDATTIQYLGLWDARGAGIGGWTLGVHHTLDPAAGFVYEGTGTQRQLALNTLNTLLSHSEAFWSLSAAADGSLLTTGRTACTRIRRYFRDGTFEIIAGEVSGCTRSSSVPAGPGLEGISPTYAIEAPDGSILITETTYHRISRIELDGSWSPVTGSVNNEGYTGDGGPAIDATLSFPRGLAVGSDGAIYFSDTFNSAIRRVTPDGLIETVAGGNGPGFAGDGGPAVDAKLSAPGHLAIAADGSIYVIDQGARFPGSTGTTRGTLIRRIDPTGIIETIAGDGTSGGVSSRPVESGVPAISTGIDAEALVVTESGDVFFTEIINHIVRRITPDGIIVTYAGIPGAFGYAGDGGPAIGAQLFSPVGIAYTPGGTLVVNDSENDAFREITERGVQLDDTGETLVPSDEGTEIFVFDSGGNHLRTVDALNGHLLHSFSYDDDGRLLYVDDGRGRYLTINRPDEETIELVTRTGESNRLGLDANGYLASLTMPGGETRTVVHDEDGLLTRFADFAGNESDFTYDDLGRLEADENPLGFSASLQTNSEQNLDVTLTDVHGAASTFTTSYDVEGNKINERTEAYGGATIAVEAPDGLLSVVFEDGTEMDYVLEPDPRWGLSAPFEAARTIRLPSGLTYEIASQIQLELDQDDQTVVTLATQTSLNGSTFSMDWDADTRTVTETSAEGLTTTRTIDSLGRLLSYQQDPAYAAASFTYDAAGRLQQVTRGPGQFSMTYNAEGRRDSISNNTGLMVSNAYDANGRVNEITLTSGRVLGLGYSADSQIEQLTLPGNAIHRMSYNETGFLESYTPPGGIPLTFAARNDGSLGGTTLPGGRIATRTFDASGRPTGWVYPEASVAADYLPNTNRVSNTTWTPSSGAAQALALEYDGPLITRLDWAGVANAQVDLRYDAWFNVVGTSLNGDTERTITRDADGRVMSDGPFAWLRTNPRRAVSSISDGVATIEQTTTNIGLLASRSLTVNGIDIYAATLSYRNDRRLADLTEVIGGVADTRSFVYDADNQLVAVTSGASTRESYEYDDRGNLTVIDVGTPVANTYDIQDRLEQFGSTSVTVDVDGQMTAIGADAFSFSTRGDLLSATVNGVTIDFTYDGYNRRVASTNDSGTTSYVYGNPDVQTQLTAVREPDGTWLEFYYDETGLLYAIDRSGSWLYVATDHIGTPLVVADASGTIVKQIDYSAYGSLLNDSNPGLELHVGFAGGLRDATTGLVHFGYRSYHPDLGRFIKRDPLLFRGNSMNLYGYAYNDPINIVDRNGFFGGLVAPPGSVGGGYHAGFGAVAEISSDGAGGYGFCFGVGVGAGSTFGLDPSGRPETSWRVEGGYTWKIPITKTDVGVDTAIRWIKCPPGSPIPGYFKFENLSPSISQGPVSISPDGISFGGGEEGSKTGGLGAGASGSANFVACTEI